jgi:acyl-CoA reductase-like NAD-dependent aldehyde dehydrogenase
MGKEGVKMNLEQQQDQVVVSGQLSSVEVPEGMPPSSQTEIDEALEILEAHKNAWANLDIQARIDILDEIMEDLPSVAERWIEACIAAQELQDNSFGLAESSVIFSIVYRIVRILRQSLIDIQQSGHPRIPGPVGRRANGQIVAGVFPQNLYDRISMMGYTAEVWMKPESPEKEGRPSQASFYHWKDKEGKVALVLGVGNVAAIVVADFMYKLFVEGQVVLLKPSPVNEYLGPLFEEGFRALIDRNFLRFVYGGGKEGAYLVNHPLVETIHMTGSEKTFNSVVFGPGEEGEKRKQERHPKITKPVTAELGNISPVIIVPGPWDESDITAQAAKIGTWLSVNAGYGCLTPRMLINWKGWDQRDKLNSATTDFLSQVPTRKAYYPGTIGIQERFVAEHPEALQLGDPTEGQLPWTLIPNVNAEKKEDICFTQEAFCGLFAETGLDAESVAGFIDKAVDFANDTLWGTLVASIIVHPKSMKDPKIAAAVERAIENLRYGTVVVNEWGVTAYMLMTTPWGSYPGQDIYDVQSGIGSVNNLLMFDEPQKAVVRCPFKANPDPFRANSRNAPEFGRRMVEFQLKPSLGTLTRLFVSVLKT